MPRPHPRPARRARRTLWPAFLLATVVANLVTACQAQPKADAPRAAEAALLQRIEAEVGQASCSSTAECRTLPIGSKACGGPTRWMAWSATASQGDRLQALAADLALRQRLADVADGRMSTCSVVPDPGAGCETGRCVLLKGNSAR